MVLSGKKDSIYFQLLRLLLISAAAAFVFCMIVNHISDYAVENYYASSGYEKMQDQKYLSRLQSYISENQVSYKDTEKLKKWVKKQQILILRVYVNDKKVFDSDYPDKELWEEDIESGEYDWETYYSVKFADGTARAGIIGFYEYQLYTYIFVIELASSFILFLILVLLGIRKK